MKKETIKKTPPTPEPKKELPPPNEWAKISVARVLLKAAININVGKEPGDKGALV